jgi:hypothetical protein
MAEPDPDCLHCAVCLLMNRDWRHLGPFDRVAALFEAACDMIENACDAGMDRETATERAIDMLTPMLGSIADGRYKPVGKLTPIDRGGR